MSSHFRLFIAMSLLLATGCTGSKAEVPPAELDDRISVETMTAEQGSLREVVAFSGVLTPRISLTLSAEVGGLIKELSKDKGDLVVGDELLARIEEEPFNLAEKQATVGLRVAELRVAQLETAIEVERHRLQAAQLQAAAGVDAANARLQLTLNGARKEEKSRIKAALRAAEAGMENAKLQLDRVKSLMEASAATQQQLDLAETQWKTAVEGFNQAREAYRLVMNGAREEDKDAARAGLKQAEAGVKVSEAAMGSLKIQEKELEAAKIQVEVAQLQLDNAVFNRSKTQLKAPLEKGEKALVLSRFVDKGEMVGPGMPVYELMTISNPRLAFMVSGRDINFFRQGIQVTANCIGDGSSIQRTGTVVFASRQADSHNATFSVELEMDNEDGKLRMGQICEVYPELARHDGVLIPRDIIRDTEGGKVVMVEKDGIIREKFIKVAAVRNGKAVVTEGLTPGENVVLVGARLVGDGTEVVVRQQHKLNEETRPTQSNQ